MKVSVITRKNKLPHLKKMAQKLAKANAEYGYFKEQGLHPDDNPRITYANLMNAHEHGTPTIPARKPFAISLFQNKKTILNFTLKALDKYMMTASNKMLIPLENTLSTFGSLGVYHTRALFGSTALLPNQEPIRKKSGSKTSSPLVDLGDLRDNMAYRSSESKEIKT